MFEQRAQRRRPPPSRLQQTLDVILGWAGRLYGRYERYLAGPVYALQVLRSLFLAFDALYEWAAVELVYRPVAALFKLAAHIAPTRSRP